MRRCMLDDHVPNDTMLRALRDIQAPAAFNERYVSDFGVASHQKVVDLFEQVVVRHGAERLTSAGHAHRS